MADSTVLITLAGHAPSVDLLQWRAEEASLSIAVDGGWLAHRHAKVEPDVVLGDFDSCGDVSEIEKIFPRTAIEKLPDQEHTDFEKALNWIMGKETPAKIIILGGLGKRMDHSLSNLMIAGRINPSVEIVFDDEHEHVRRITPQTPLSLKGRKGTSLSLLPMGACEQVESIGLNWELEKAEFSWDRMVSQSNQCASDDVRITCKSGVLYSFVCKEA